MFDELMRELRRLESSGIPVSLPTDEDGYLDRECPSAECLSQFKVHVDDWRDKVRDDEVFCPCCRHTADAKKWFTTDQVEQMGSTARAHVKQRIGGAMRRDAQRWNHSQPRNSLIRVTMKVNDCPTQILLPRTAADPMRLKITCPECTCRYAVIGAAFFCPACGHNAADLMFSQTLNALRNSLEAIAAVRAAIPDRDTAETTARLLVENALQNAVTTFHRYAEVLYTRYPARPRARRNAFQSITEGSELWHGATGKRYGDYLDGRELASLIRLFQQRHLLAHTQGLVDEDYIKRSGDTSYREGQRLVVREVSVQECLGLIEKLASAMAGELRSP